MSALTTLHECKRQRGLSLIELMISLAIGLVLLVGITTLIVQQSSTRDELEKSSRQIENGRYAMQILHTDLQQAGFYGLYYNLPPYGQSLGLVIPPAAPLPDPCLTTLANLYGGMPLPIQGYKTLPAAANFSCPLNGVSSANNANNYLTGTDILVIRRTDTGSPINFTAASSPVTTANLTLGQVYLQTNSGSAVISVGTGTTGDTTTYPLYLSTRSIGAPIYAPLRQYVVHIYFISPCSVPADGSTSCTGSNDDNGNPIPTLKLLELSVVGNVPAFKLTPLVEGIENIQMDYGVDGDAAALPTTDGYPDFYCANPDGVCPGAALPALSATNPTNWQNVMAVRVNLMSRNTDPTVGYCDVKTYSLSGVSGVAAIGPLYTGAAYPTVPVECPSGITKYPYPQRYNYKRHVFSELVRLINPSGRRAQQ